MAKAYVYFYVNKKCTQTNDSLTLDTTKYVLKNQANSPCSPAATAKVRRPLIVAGEYLVGVHPSAHLAVEGTPVVLSLVLWEVAFGYCYNMRHSRHFGFRISQRKAVKRPVIPKIINKLF